MRAAAVDIGTNSVRLLIVDAEERGGRMELNTLRRMMTITRLGEGVDRRGALLPAATSRTLEVLRGYRELMEAEAVEIREVAATSAVRDADNAGPFLREAGEILGVEPRVVSGEEEARLSFLGATYDLGDMRPRRGALLVVDIGGGSTEVILGEGRSPLEVYSLDVGCVRMTERFLRSDPPTAEELAAMEDHLRSVLGPIARRVKGRRPALAIGLAGTVTTLAGILLGLAEYRGELVHHSWLAREEAENLYGHLAGLDVEGRRRFMRLEPGRADVIVGGCGVLVVLMRELGLHRLLVSEKDILDGLVLQACGEETKAAGSESGC